MIDEHADAALRLGGASWSTSGQVIDALQVFDDHTLDAQVGAPDLLDQFGVVTALDEDAARAGDAGARLRSGRRIRMPCAAPLGAAGRTRGHASTTRRRRPGIRRRAGRRGVCRGGPRVRRCLLDAGDGADEPGSGSSTTRPSTASTVGVTRAAAAARADASTSEP